MGERPHEYVPKAEKLVFLKEKDEDRDQRLVTRVLGKYSQISMRRIK